MNDWLAVWSLWGPLLPIAFGLGIIVGTALAVLARIAP